MTKNNPAPRSPHVRVQYALSGWTFVREFHESCCLEKNYVRIRIACGGKDTTKNGICKGCAQII